jgi:ABC-type uncharacterized transport system permease subunit
MKIRELLQTEIWSKRTTWILLVGVVALAGLGQLGWYTVIGFTFRERNEMQGGKR